MKKKTLAVIAVLVAIGVVGALVLRALQARRAGAVASVTAPAAPAALELAAADLARVATLPLVRTVEVSGGLVAVRSAVVKARVAAEVREIGVREGDSVRAGQRLARLDDTEVAWRLRQAREQAASAQAQLDIAERTLANNEALVAQGFISRNALQTSASNVAAARATLQAAQAAAELAAKSVRDTEVTAPLAGQVAQRFVQPGERVGVDARLVEIVDLSQLELAAPLAPADAAAVRPGQAVQLTVEGLDAPVRGTVARVNPSAQAGTRAVQAYIALAPAAGLRQGLFARGTIALGSAPARVVPLSALRVDQARPYVLGVADGRVAAQPVEPGRRGLADFGLGAEAAVEVAALADGLPVLRGSVGTLQPGTAVRLP